MLHIKFHDNSFFASGVEAFQRPLFMYGHGGLLDHLNRIPIHALGQIILVGWLFGFNGPLRQYFSLYRAVSQSEEEKGSKG